MGHFERKFQTEEGIAYHPLLMSGQKTRAIALLCGIKISAVHCLVVRKCVCVPDRQTDGQTVRITTPKTALAQLRRAVIRRKLQELF